MIFEKITLTNIGAYQGSNKIDFTVRDSANTILIGGKNGSGKTTFLSAVRLALYGSLTYGYKTDSREYYKKVRELLNKKALNLRGSKFQIQIDFSIVEDFKRKQCTISREWEYNVEQDMLKEHVYVVKDDKYLDELLKDEFFNSLKNNFPPSLLELCLFDGEDISKIITGNNLSVYLKELSSIIFNLDIFSSLEKNLKVFSETQVDHKEYGDLLTQQSSLKEKASGLRMEIAGLEDSRETNRSTLEGYLEEIEQQKEQFSLYGGLVQEEREKINKEIVMIENERKNNAEDLKEFVAKELPFFLVKNLFDNALVQLEKEEEHFLNQSLENKIHALAIDELLIESGISLKETQVNDLKGKLIDRLSAGKDVELIHLASKTEAQSAQALHSKLTDDKLRLITTLMEKQKTSLNSVQSYKKQLKDNAETSEFKNILETIATLTTKVNVIELEIEKDTNEISTIQKELIKIEKELEKVEKKVHDFVKEDNSLLHSEKLMTISKEFREFQLQAKLKDVEYFSSKMFQNVMRKNNFVKNIYISPETYVVSLKSFDGVTIDKDRLSAGEKELLILSIIWGVFQAAKREVPFIFDTLLGRLDKEHKKSVVTKMIPAFGKQVIILSTDSEIDENLHQKMGKFISHEFTLNYSNELQATKVEEGFFN